MTATPARIPTSHLDLLERPLYGHLAMTRPDGQPQVTPMWYVWDGEVLRFTTTTTRQKYLNAQHESRVALSVNDPEQPYRYLEVRGIIERIDPDPEGHVFDQLAARYGYADYQPPVADAPDRIVLVVRPIATSKQ